MSRDWYHEHDMSSRSYNRSRSPNRFNWSNQSVIVRSNSNIAMQKRYPVINGRYAPPAKTPSYWSRVGSRIRSVGRALSPKRWRKRSRSPNRRSNSTRSTATSLFYPPVSYTNNNNFRSNYYNPPSSSKYIPPSTRFVPPPPAEVMWPWMTTQRRNKLKKN